ncbi:uncharacterized protein LOC144143153 [Haemaphysalis longicornis]
MATLSSAGELRDTAAADPVALASPKVSPQVSEMSEISQTGEVSELSSGVEPPPMSMEERQEIRERKRLIIIVGFVIIVLLLIVDLFLLYLWLTAKPTIIEKTVTKTAEARELTDTAPLYPKESEDTYLLLEDISPLGLDTADVRGSHHVCNTSGCRWLRVYLRSGAARHRDGRAGPCDDFYEHVCAGRRHSVYEEGATRLMDVVRARLVGQDRGAAPADGREEPLEDGDAEGGEVLEGNDGVLQRCLRGAAVVTKDDISRTYCRDSRDEACPPSLPDAPRRASDDFFRKNPNASIDNYVALIQSLAPDLSLEGHVHLRQAKRVSTPSSKRWIARTCRWVALSARCHLTRTRPTVLGQLPLYQLIWKLLYFAPFMGKQMRGLVKLAYLNYSKPRLQICMRVVEEVFPKKTAQVANAALTETVGNIRDTLASFLWEAKQVMRTLVPCWMARADGGNRTDKKAKLHELPSQQLDIIDATIDDGSATTQPHSSLYSWQVRYAEEHKALVVPPGLLALLLRVSSSVEPMLVPLIGLPLMRELMPTRRGPYAWRWRHQRRLDAVVKCVATATDIAGTDQEIHDLAEETALESGVLLPLFALYKRRLLEELGQGVRLHRDYTNAELFFVLWALGHCGERRAQTLVNGALKNSALFARTFQCSVNQAMWEGRRCPFWI